MKGIYHIEISNRDAKFKFDLYRNITIVRGDSGTGKTTLFDMVVAYTRLKQSSGVNVSCAKNCVALIDIDWENQIKNIKDSIVFIDEGFEQLKTTEFASAIKASDNYYVIFTRDNLHSIPYSVEEIYEIKTSGKYHSFKKLYKADGKHVYGTAKKMKYASVLTEDSKAGYEFFSKYADNKGMNCFSAGSNASVFKWIQEKENSNTLVIADGAAFGSEMNRVMKLQECGAKFRLCLPESFEWLILKSGLIKSEDIIEILNTPSEYIESSKFFSWERFFSSLLINETVGTPFKYEKDEMNPTYLNHQNISIIVKEIGL